jgi:hypothetical protein
VSDPSWLAWFWAVWLTLLVAGFILAETVALVHPGRGGALTEWTKRHLGVHPPQPRRKWAILVFVAGLTGLTIWLIPHMTHWPFIWPWE